MTTLKTDSNIRYIEETAKIKIAEVITYNDYYETEVRSKKFKNWRTFVEESDMFDEDFRVDEVFCLGGMLSTACGLNRSMNKWTSMYRTQNQMNFVANGVHMSAILQAVKLSNKLNIPFYEFCYDPLENSIAQCEYHPNNLTVYHGYAIDGYGMTRLDSLQHYLLTQPPKFFELDKDITFTFGMTVLTEVREAQYENAMKSIASIPSKAVYVRHKYLEIDTFVERDKYLEKIERSKFTFIVPAYDKMQFSIYRFIESVYYNCLPLLASDCHLADFISSFDLDTKIVDEIIVDYDELDTKIKSITEARRLELIAYFKDKVLVYDRQH